MQLTVFDENLNFKGTLETQFSFRRVRRYSKCGEFEINCIFKPELMELLSIDSVIWVKGDYEAGYITDRNIQVDAENKEIMTINGKFQSGYLGKRIIWGTETINDTVENGIRQLVNKNCISPSNTDRKIPLLELGPLKNIPTNIDYQVSYKNLLEEVEKLAKDKDIGFRTLIDVNNKTLTFDVYEGLDRSRNQNINSKCIFSQEFENVLEQQYNDGSSNYRNVALIAGEGEGNERTLETIGNDIGLDRYELFVDANDVRSKREDETIIPVLEYKELLKTRGYVKLSENRKIKVFDSKINLNSNLKYKIDFDLGDIATCTSKKLGVTVDSRITEIEEVYEENGLEVFVTFGNNVADLLDKIKSVIN